MSNKFNSIFITGGAGYCGSLIVPTLLQKGLKVKVYDTLFFSDKFLPKHKNLEVVKADIRDIEKFKQEVSGFEVVLHLACISNDASFELDEKLSTSINLDAFEPLVEVSKSAGVKRFIYASSSSVYGVSEERDVTEEHPLVPLTLYNKYKGLCEPILNSYKSDDFVVTTFRPATVCGYAPRLRLDLSVNILTNHAINKDKITVFGGSQLRPNLHVKDYVRACELFIGADSKSINGEVFNVGQENMSILDLAHVVRKVVMDEFPDKREVTIERTESNDNRSYHINSEKIKRDLNFSPIFGVEDAIRDLCEAFKNGKVSNSFDDDIFFNIRTMKKIQSDHA